MLDGWKRDFAARVGVTVNFLDAHNGDVSTDQNKVSLLAQISKFDVAAVDTIHLGELQDEILPLSLKSSLLSTDVGRWQSGEAEDDSVTEVMSVPWYADFGVLFYRSDLLAKYGFPEPGPDGWTFDEMEEIAWKVQEGERENNTAFHGYVWPGHSYEGLTCTALEVLAGQAKEPLVDSSGGIRTDDPGLIETLQRMSGWIWGARKISPSEVLGFRESDIRRRFCEEADAMFARHWASFIADCDNEGMAGRFGVTRLPGVTRRAGRGVRGGAALVVSKYTNNLEAAKKFVNMSISLDWQWQHWITSQRIPTRRDLQNNASLCTSINRTVCRTQLNRITSVPARMPGSDPDHTQEVIVEESSGLCAPARHIATACDVDRADYIVDRAFLATGSAYSSVSGAFVEVVHSALNKAVHGDEAARFARDAICRAIEASRRGSRLHSRHIDGSRAFSCSVERCPEGEYMVDGFGRCERCSTLLINNFCCDNVLYIGTCLLAFVGLLTLYLWLMRLRKQSNALWKVKIHELNFGPQEQTPEVLGRGTFGLVIKAEYRGTAVAVKRVIPPDESRHFEHFGSFASCTVQVVPSGRSSVGRFRQSTVSNHSRLRTWNPTGSTSPQPGSRALADGRDVHVQVDEDVVVPTPSLRMGKEPTINTNGSTVTRSLRGRFRRLLRLSRMVICCQTAHERRLADLRADFVREMKILSKLRHPCVLTVMGAVISKRTEPMLIMELMEHGSLYDLLHNETFELEGETVLPILRDIAQGLRFLHSATPEIVHGDLKAANVLVDRKFRAKVADFGLSQKKKVGACGTPFWMAPELLRGSRNTVASDIYAFGILLNEVYSRKDPYFGEHPGDVLAAVMDPSQNKRPEIPSTCADEVRVLMKDCWQEEPKHRPRCEELDRRLAALRADVAEFVDNSAQRKLERRTTSDLLHDVFPRHIAEALRLGQKIEPEARECVTIFFSDIVGFTDISATLSPEKVSAMLHHLYSKFDMLSEQHQVFKVETIGDAYMAVANLVEDQPDHAKRIAMFAQGAVAAARETLIDEEQPERGCVNIRVGFHSGPVVANVVGRRNLRYCLFGDTVNTASRMESNSERNRVHCSAASAELLKEQAPEVPLRSRGTICIKGKGEMHTFWVHEKDPVANLILQTSAPKVAMVSEVV